MNKLTIWEALRGNGYYWFECLGADPERGVCQTQNGSLLINTEEIDPDLWQDADFWGPLAEPEEWSS